MATFLRPQTWEIQKEGYKDWLNLDLFIKKIINSILHNITTALSLKEDKSNKVSVITPSTEKYPNNQAVIDYVNISQLGGIKNTFIEITLSQLGLTNINQVTEAIIQSYINTQNYVQTSNENLYFKVKESLETFDTTFDNTFN